MNKKINGVSLFSSAGIGELLLKKSKIKIRLANELIAKRADCYRFLHPDANMIQGDISNEEIKQQIIKDTNSCRAKFLLATPPCQGFSTLGKNKIQKNFATDFRNYLIFDIFEIIDHCDFDYILIENVPNFLKMLFPWKGSFANIISILLDKYKSHYTIDYKVLNSEFYGVPQSRPRCIIKMYKPDLIWGWPKKQKIITLKEAIGNLPSLVPGEKSEIKWHYAKKENPRIILAMEHTPTGKSALLNPVYYPKKENGERIKGFHNTFTRMKWDEPAPARTMYSGSMSSHNNVHPGRLLSNGLYSDPRVLTLYETFKVSSIPTNIDFPPKTTDSFIRELIGEAIPPKMLLEIVKMIGER